MTDAIDFVIAVILLVAVIPHFIAFLVLNRAARRGEPISALDERTVAANWWLVSATTIALLVLNVLLGRPLHIDPPWSQLMIGFALLAGAVPAFLFTLRYYGGRFRD